MKSYRIACIPGDGIGKEVIPAGQRVLAALAESRHDFRFEFSTFGWGGDWYREHGEMMPADGLLALKPMDAILFGSAGDPDIPDHITLWGLRLKATRSACRVRRRISFALGSPPITNASTNRSASDFI